MADRDGTLQAIDQRMKKIGDLPIFSASLNRIRKVSTDPESTALALTREVEKDANLTAKLLSLANSSYYNSGKGKIGSISRAVVLLGFNTIGNICLTLKLIESFQREQPSIDISRMMVNAYLSAGFAREVALRSGLKDVEDIYTSALLHNLGKVSVAYFLPEKFLRIEAMQQQGRHDYNRIQQEVLGTTFEEVGQHLGKSWELPSNIVSTMQHVDPANVQPGLKGIMLNRALASLGNTIVEVLHSGHEGAHNNLSDLLSRMADTAGLAHELVENDLVESFKMSCELAASYGLKRTVLAPDLAESGDEFRDRLAGRLSYLATNYNMQGTGVRVAVSLAAGGDKAPVTSASTVRSMGAQSGGKPPLAHDPAPAVSIASDKQMDTSLQLAIVQEITLLLTSGARPNDVLIKVVDGMHRGVKFDRVVLILVSPDRASYSVRLSAGEDVARLRDYFQRPLLPESDLFSRLILEGKELTVDDCSDPSWQPLLSGDFPQRTGASAFMLGALRNGPKPIGLFYADNAATQSPISEAQKRGFQQFLTQAHLAIQVSNTGRS